MLPSRAELAHVHDRRSGWEPVLSGGYGYGGAPPAADATRDVPNRSVGDVPPLPPGGYGGHPGAAGEFVHFVSPACAGPPGLRACALLLG